MNLLNDALDVANVIDPSNPVVEAAEAAVTTIADPSQTNIIADVELAVSLVKQLKAALEKADPKVAQFVKRLL